MLTEIVAATWFPNRKGLAVGFVACGASIAGVVYPTMTRYLIESMGFNNAVRIVATLVTLTALYSLTFATPNPEHFHHKPQSFRALKTWIDTDALKNKAFIWFTFAVAFMFFGFYPVFFNLEEWAANRGFGTRGGAHTPVHILQSDNKPLQTFWLLTIMNGASTIGRLTMATFSDKTGPLNMHIGAQIITSLLTLILWTLANSTVAAIAFCVFFGISSGTVIGLPPASVANILACTYTSPGTKHFRHQKLGQWTGMMYSFAAIPSLAGPVIAGHLVTQYNTYITVQVWSGANLFLSALCMIVARCYLPCTDGEHVSVKLARMLGRHKDTEKNARLPGSNIDPEKQVSGLDSDTEMESPTPAWLSQAPTPGFSQVPTAVPSQSVSRVTSDNKVPTLDPFRQDKNIV